MKFVLICPAERTEVSLLSAEAPLAVAPALGQSVVEYWMSHLACSGVKQVVLLAHDRPEEVRKVIGSGSRWGVAAEVIAGSREVTPEQANQEYAAEAVLMDHFPGVPERPLFDGYQHWYDALEAWIPRARTPDRVGVRELRPGVWVGLHGHISREATLNAPCWVGDHVYIGSGAIIGPGAVLENGSFIEPNAGIKNSVIGPSTFVGQYLQITHSLAWGSTLVDWQTGLETTVSEDFLLCSLHPRRPSSKGVAFMDRVAEWIDLWREERPLEPQPILVKARR